MLIELKNVMVLIGELPESYQQQAAQQLGWLLKRAEEEMTMTVEERETLRALEKKRTQALIAELKAAIDKI